MDQEPQWTPPAPQPCPLCGGKGLPIIYGMPGLEAWEAEKRGELVLGGCMVMIQEDGQGQRTGPPGFECHSCEHHFGEEPQEHGDE